MPSRLAIAIIRQLLCPRLVSWTDLRRGRRVRAVFHLHTRCGMLILEAAEGGKDMTTSDMRYAIHRWARSCGVVVAEESIFGRTSTHRGMPARRRPSRWDVLRRSSMWKKGTGEEEAAVGRPGCGHVDGREI